METDTRRTSKWAMLPLLLALGTWGDVFLTALLVVAALYFDSANALFVALTAGGAVGLALSVATLASSVLAVFRIRASGEPLKGGRWAILGALAGVSGGALVASPLVAFLLWLGTLVLLAVLLVIAVVWGELTGNPVSLGFHGRPVPGRRFRAALPIGVRGKPRDVHAGLAWARSAVAEHESVEAFETLACDLESLGAPPDLAARARVAAAEEADHANRCVALAERHLGLALRPVSFGRSRPPVTLELLADEALHDGLLGEGVAAAVADAAARQVDDPETANTLRVIAKDEASHAALAGDVLRWAQARGVQPTLRARAPRFPALPAHGGLAPHVQAALFDQQLAAARALVG